MYKVYLKRVIDFALCLVALALLWPIFLLLMVLLGIQNGGNPFFYQNRPGYRERPFGLLKFKTMTDQRDADGKLLPDNKRLTKLGAIARSASLDELPQLFNVLRGEMSLVGPRPLLFSYIPLYNDEQRRRHNVKPGITGWAQVNGRNSISWQQKFKYDVYYVDNLSFALDLRILWLTIRKVLVREGINQSAERPMEPFNGMN